METEITQIKKSRLAYYGIATWSIIAISSVTVCILFVVLAVDHYENQAMASIIIPISIVVYLASLSMFTYTIIRVMKKTSRWIFGVMIGLLTFAFLSLILTFGFQFGFEIEGMVYIYFFGATGYLVAIIVSYIFYKVTAKLTWSSIIRKEDGIRGLNKKSFQEEEIEKQKNYKYL
ncbi:MAG: hypothetical protein ACTSQ4_12265 [Candidatus Heimdallarchaeaceae archaeon]